MLDTWNQNVSALAVNYFTAKHVKSVTVISYWEAEERYDFFLAATRKGLLVKFVDATNIEALIAIHPNRVSQAGLLIDASCEIEPISKLWQMVEK